MRYQIDSNSKFSWKLKHGKEMSFLRIPISIIIFGAAMNILNVFYNVSIDLITQ